MTVNEETIDPLVNWTGLGATPCSTRTMSR
jgi:hypothetical protein